jgi:hypothetical protein
MIIIMAAAAGFSFHGTQIKWGNRRKEVIPRRAASTNYYCCYCCPFACGGITNFRGGKILLPKTYLTGEKMQHCNIGTQIKIHSDFYSNWCDLKS